MGEDYRLSWIGNQPAERAGHGLYDIRAPTLLPQQSGEKTIGKINWLARGFAGVFPLPDQSVEHLLVLRRQRA